MLAQAQYAMHGLASAPPRQGNPKRLPKLLQTVARAETQGGGLQMMARLTGQETSNDCTQGPDPPASRFGPGLAFCGLRRAV